MLPRYVDFAQSIEGHHPNHGQSFPWALGSHCSPPSLPILRTQLEHCLESMVQEGIKLGTISSHQVFTTLSKWHGLNTALRRILQSNPTSSSSKRNVSDRVSTSALWARAVFALSGRSNAEEIDGILGLGEKGNNVSLEEASFYKEALVALKLAKEVIRIQQGWRANAVMHLIQTSGISRSLAHSATD